MEKSDLQNTWREIALYLSFVGWLFAVKFHKIFMKPSGEEIDHWTASIYGLSDHTYHLFHASVGFIVTIVVSLVFFKITWKIVRKHLWQ